MALRTVVLLIAGLGLGLASAQEQPKELLPKPALQPPFDMQGAVSDGLRAALPVTPYTGEVWAPGFLPRDCKHMAEDEGFAAADVQVFSVAYADCGEPWILCRHAASAEGLDDIAQAFGRLPLGMREHAKHFLALPALRDGNAGLSSGGSTMVADGAWWMNLLVHEVSHSLDSSVALPDVAPRGGLSDSALWRARYAADAATVSDYGRRGWQEDLAEAGPVALYELLVPGGALGINPNFGQVIHQVLTYQSFYKDIITPNFKPQCTDRLNNSDIVSVADDAENGQPKPDVSFKTPVKIIDPGVFHNVTFTHPQ
ncbi:hypothetical protein F4780DRAFT_794313 [Xylariomycetidae sp. FL0641]|nr:hypothetical protein F4780DRAFT_794313 [Xylariomycetidae sp. FL0641]